MKETLSEKPNALFQKQKIEQRIHYFKGHITPNVDGDSITWNIPEQINSPLGQRPRAEDFAKYLLSLDSRPNKVEVDYGENGSGTVKVSKDAYDGLIGEFNQNMRDRTDSMGVNTGF